MSEEYISDLQEGLRPSPSSFSFQEMDLLRYSNTTSDFNQVPLNNNETADSFLFPREVVPLQPQDLSGVVVGNDDDRKRRKTSEFPRGTSVPVKTRKQGSGGGGGGGRGKKIIKGDDEEEEGDRGRKEVVHVRARRGQATDRHSLAERVRRGKIDERLRCLQDIVPGCYKTMGLAVMLDEIISYVQSLQHQVEFLSMNLTAASSFYDFNSESDLIDAMRRAEAYEAKEIEKIIMRGSSLQGL